MARHYITDGKGKDVRTSDGERLFWSDRDGDSNPKHNQTVYREHKGLFGGSSKVDSRYAPSSGKFKK
ncbi:MAG TPA: hypothetical protein ENN18_08865 [Proteobacteria bacterium]|nr:hypothetical protein [Pseudomonadota bacterium]